MLSPDFKTKNGEKDQGRLYLLLANSAELSSQTFPLPDVSISVFIHGTKRLHLPVGTLNTSLTFINIH